MRLSNLIRNLDIIDINGGLNIEITNIHYDSREIKDKGLFICINGFNSNGHNYIKSAIKNGAKAFLIEEDINLNEINKKDFTFIKVNNTRKSMAIISDTFYNSPSSKLNIIGITGTNGKTTTSYLLKDVLDKIQKCGLIGTINIDDGVNNIESKNTTPESLDLQRIFNNMLSNNCKYCSMEVSSHSLELDRVEQCEFSIGVFTNLTKEHLDFHNGLIEYRNAKQKLFFKTNTANLINIDDEHGNIIFDNIKKLNVPAYTYCINEDNINLKEADFVASDIKLYSSGVSYKLKTPTYTEDIYINIPGRFSVYNTLAVIGTCYILGIDINIVKEALKNTRGIRGRFETIKNNKNINVIIDYAHTPDALENVLSTVKEFTDGKIITVFGCGGDRDKIKRPIMGAISQNNSDITIITSDNPRHENLNLIIYDILSGIDKNKENYKVIENRKDAISKAIEMATEKDVVIIAGKGHEKYQIIGDIKHYFDDYEVALEFINLK